MAIMKKCLLVLCSFTFSLYSVEVMKTFKGRPNMIVQSSLTFGNDLIVAKFKLPPKWGIGESDFLQNRTGHFLLFPSHGGFGCDVTIEYLKSEKAVNEKMHQIKSSLGSVTEFSNGFEWSNMHAFFCCQKQAQTLVQIWYPLKKITVRDKNIWELLKKSVTIEKPVKSPSKIPSKELKPPPKPSMQSDSSQFVFHSPKSDTAILVKKDLFFDSFKINRDQKFKYLLEIDNERNNIKGFFYIDWKIDPKNIKDSYKKFITNIEKEVSQINPSQQQIEPIIFSPEGAYALYKGNPYYILVVRSKDSMVGFAATPRVDMMIYNFSDLLKQIKWNK